MARGKHGMKLCLGEGVLEAQTQGSNERKSLPDRQLLGPDDLLRAFRKQAIWASLVGDLDPQTP